MKLRVTLDGRSMFTQLVGMSGLPVADGSDFLETSSAWNCLMKSWLPCSSVLTPSENFICLAA